MLLSPAVAFAAALLYLAVCLTCTTIKASPYAHDAAAAPLEPIFIVGSYAIIAWLVTARAARTAPMCGAAVAASFSAFAFFAITLQVADLFFFLHMGEDLRYSTLVMALGVNRVHMLKTVRSKVSRFDLIVASVCTITIALFTAGGLCLRWLCSGSGSSSCSGSSSRRSGSGGSSGVSSSSSSRRSSIISGHAASGHSRQRVLLLAALVAALGLSLRGLIDPSRVASALTNPCRVSNAALRLLLEYRSEVLQPAATAFVARLPLDDPATFGDGVRGHGLAPWWRRRRRWGERLRGNLTDARAEADPQSCVTATSPHGAAPGIRRAPDVVLVMLESVRCSGLSRPKLC